MLALVEGFHHKEPRSGFISEFNGTILLADGDVPVDSKPMWYLCHQYRDLSIQLSLLEHRGRIYVAFIG